MHDGIPQTVRDWLDAWLSGASPRSLLTACRARAASSPIPGVWIHHVGDGAFEAQLRALEAIALQHVDPHALIARFPLFGVPFAVKDNIDVAGAPTTAACPEFAYVADASANVVRRLVAAGAVWIGKTNLDQFATGLVGTRSPYGQPASVFDTDRISGGSSSGSAVAVASGLVAFALGTDTAGSGRVPAGFNQLVGLKPTPGRVGTSGIVPACRSLDCVSIFALSVEDAGHILATIEGDDVDDVYSCYRPGPAAFASRALRVGIPDPLPVLEAGYADAYRVAQRQAEALGHRLVPIDFGPLADTAALLYSGPWVAERHAVVQALLERAPDAFDPTVRTVIGGATRFTATDCFRAEYALRALRQRAETVWHEVDLLLVPTAPLHPTFAAVAADPVGVNTQLGTFTNFVNLLGWCALALPAGTTPSGLPFGVTAIAAADVDAALARFGDAWQRALDLPLGGSARRLVVEATDGATPAHALRAPAAEATLPIAVVGAHLSGMPLNGQLVERGARLQSATATAPRYHLYALPGTAPPKPGLVRAGHGGHAIAVEVWDMPIAQVGSFLALVPAPLGIGRIELADGRWVHGFVCEAQAVAGARDISAFGGWREYLAALAKAAPLGAAA